MTLSERVALEIGSIRRLLRAVPVCGEPQEYFLETYKLQKADLQSLALSEAEWEQRHPVPTNKLLKLGISFGNLIKAYQLDSESLNQRHPGLAQDPFQEGELPLAPKYIRFVQNLYSILKNFDIGLRPHAEAPHGGAPQSSPIRVSSRQLLIEKLEINMKLDALFTFQIVLQLLENIFVLLEQLLGTNDFEEAPLSETLLLFSQSLLASVNLDVATLADYGRLVREVHRRVRMGLLDPFKRMVMKDVVEPRLTASFQTLLSSV